MKKILFVLLLAFCINGMSVLVSAQTNATMKVKIYFPREDYDNEVKLVAVERIVRRNAKVADTALRELLKGVTDEEKKKGLTSAYSVSSIVTGREECQNSSMKPLGEYLIGVAIKKGTATVNFKPEAECYLQTAIAMMDMVMLPIEKTLMQFKTVKRVQFALNGKVITEWDA